MTVAQLTRRQQEMLELMGVDLWQLRPQTNANQVALGPAGADWAEELTDPPAPHPTAVKLEQATDNNSEAVAEPAACSADAEMETQISPEAVWFFVLQMPATDQFQDTQYQRLYDAILDALGLTRDSVSSLFYRAVVPFGGEPQPALLDALQLGLDQCKPSCLMVLGADLARNLLATDKSISRLRQEQYRYQGGDTRLRIRNK